MAFRRGLCEGVSGIVKVHYEFILFMGFSVLSLNRRKGFLLVLRVHFIPGEKSNLVIFFSC